MYDEQEIREHIEKFQRYMQFEEEKKELLAFYKELKEKRKCVLTNYLRKEEAA